MLLRVTVEVALGEYAERFVFPYEDDRPHLEGVMVAYWWLRAETVNVVIKNATGSDSR